MTKPDAALRKEFPLLAQTPATAAGIEPETHDSLDMMIAPDPVGHFMLVALPQVEIRTAGGVFIPETVSDRERAASVIGTVIEMGPDCYVDPAPKLPDNLPPGTPVTLLAARPRFPSGPWCKKGDTVLFSRYAGKRFKIEDVEFRMLADDEITATIPQGAKVGGL
ncbi:MAG: co-chaperone GroES family protein [Hyphomicrobium sp.]